MVSGFAGLIAITLLAYRNAPPIPARIVDDSGAVLFTGDDIGNGQALFLRYGLMSNGSIWAMAPISGGLFQPTRCNRIGEDTGRSAGAAAVRPALAALRRHKLRRFAAKSHHPEDQPLRRRQRHADLTAAQARAFRGKSATGPDISTIPSAMAASSRTSSRIRCSCIN